MIVDEEAAKVVQRIFDLCIGGQRTNADCKILTADKILTVMAYHAGQKGWAMSGNLYRWCAESVAGILRGDADRQRNHFPNEERKIRGAEKYMSRYEAACGHLRR